MLDGSWPPTTNGRPNISTPTTCTPSTASCSAADRTPPTWRGLRTLKTEGISLDRAVLTPCFTVRRADGTIAGIGDVEAQTRQVCENLKAAVEEAGGSMDDICRVDVYVRNMEHFEQIHKVRREYFRPPAPASTMVEVCKMTSPDYLIEINAIAVIAA